MAAAGSASHGTASDWEPAAVETRAEPISLCRKQSFGTDGQRRRPAPKIAAMNPAVVIDERMICHSLILLRRLRRMSAHFSCVLWE